MGTTSFKFNYNNILKIVCVIVLGLCCVYYLINNPNFLYRCFSELHSNLFLPFGFVAANILGNKIVLYAHRKKCVKLKTWVPGYGAYMILSVCFFVLYYKGSTLEKSQVFFEITTALLGSIFYLFLKQCHGYRIDEINDSQECENSIGALWAHGAYESYYKIVLKEIVNRISSFENENGVELMVKKMVILVPESCNVTDDLFKKEHIEFVKNLPILEVDQGANMNRKYKNPVYKIKAHKDIYIQVESPNSLLTLWNVRDTMSSELIHYHQSCFTATLKQVLRDLPCTIVRYNDTVKSPEPLYSVLISHLTDNTILEIESNDDKL